MSVLAGLLGFAMLLVSLPLAIIQRRTRLKRWLLTGLVGLLLITGALSSDEAALAEFITKANSAIEAGDYASARSIIEEALGRFPRNSDLQAILDRIVIADASRNVEELLRSGDVAVARQTLDSALGSFPNHPDLNALLAAVKAEELRVSAQAFTEGVSALNAKQYERAISLLGLVIADDPNYDNAQVGLMSARDGLALGYYNEGVRAKSRKDYAEAERLFLMAKETGGKAPAQLEIDLAEVKRIREEEAAAAAAKAEQERQEAERIASLLGPKPENSAWDGAVWPVVSFLRENLKDPKSLDVIEWSAVTVITLDGEPYWAVRCKYRAKNSFGGYVIENKVFLIRQNTVVDYIDY